MKKKFIVENLEELVCYVEGSASVLFKRSATNNKTTIEIDYSDESLLFEENKSETSFDLKIINPKLKDEDVLNDLLNLRSFKRFVDLISHLAKNNPDNTWIIIKIDLPKKLNKFHFKLNNGTLKFDYLNAKEVNLKGNNLSIDLRNDISMENCTIKANNSNLNINLNKDLKRMDIKLNKGDVTFYKPKESDFGVNLKGNNVYTEGVVNTNNNVVYCQMNTGNLKINQI